VPGYTGGTETVARELIPELVAAAPDVRFTAFVGREAGADRNAPWGQVIPAVTVPVSSRNRVEWVRGEQLLLPRLAARAGVDVIHSLANTAPVWGRFRRVVTIHDLAFRLVPDAHLGMMRFGMATLVPAAARTAHRVITDAAATAEHLRRLLKVTPQKIDVVALGLGARHHVTALPEDAVRSRFELGPRPMVLCVAAKRPHKNLMRLVSALASIPGGDRPVLVLPGYRTAYEDELRAKVRELGIESDVRFLDWIEPEALEGLYAAAACFVFPSLLEGFGLPVLEAMQRGVAVACSRTGALGEVAGDAALGFDPESPDAIASAIERILRDPPERDRLRAAGRVRVQQFTWAATARGTLDSYARALGRPVASPQSTPLGVTE
ncbi:MAG: hypothetical protein QOG59_911, partial [Solirubrobacteraceae bacterium]|nr:hypothetical protein [Solirubrobacteraceae bacterium]